VTGLSFTPFDMRGGSQLATFICNEFGQFWQWTSGQSSGIKVRLVS
jgi:hypothetical protein